MSPIERAITERITTPTGCWQRPCVTTKNGYAVIGTGRRGGRAYAHRASYEFHKGAIPAGLDIDHLCRNRACFNPEHLEAVTRSLNTRRGIHRDVMREKFLREITICKNGHPFDEHNTYWRPAGGRTCKACARINGAKSDAKRRSTKEQTA